MVESLDKTSNLFPGDDIGGKNTQHRIGSHVDHKTGRQALVDDFAGRKVDFDRQHESLAAHVHHEGVLPFQILQLLLEKFPFLANFREKPFFLKDLDEFKTETAGQGTSSEGGSVVAGPKGQ